MDLDYYLYMAEAEGYPNIVNTYDSIKNKIIKDIKYFNLIHYIKSMSFIELYDFIDKYCRQYCVKINDYIYNEIKAYIDTH